MRVSIEALKRCLWNCDGPTRKPSSCSPSPRGRLCYSPALEQHSALRGCFAWLGTARTFTHKPLQLWLQSMPLGLRTITGTGFSVQAWSGMCHAHWPVGMLYLTPQVAPSPQASREPRDGSHPMALLPAWGESLATASPSPGGDPMMPMALVLKLRQGLEGPSVLFQDVSPGKWRSKVFQSGSLHDTTNSW